MPEDRAIPAAGVSAEPRSTRAFVSDKQVLQREALGSSALQLPAYLVLLVIAAAWLGTITWASRASRPPATGPRLRPGGRRACGRAASGFGGRARPPPRRERLARPRVDRIRPLDSGSTRP